MTDHDSYITANVRKERLAQLRRDLRTHLTAARGRLTVEDVLAELVASHDLTFEQASVFFATRGEHQS